MGTAKKRIILACIIGCALIASALFVRYGIGSSKNMNTDEPAISVSNREHIQIYDSDENGIPDWQEALFSGEPITIASSSEPYEPPNTLTGQFAVQFFKEMVLAHNYGVLGDSGEALVDGALEKLERENLDLLYTSKHITTFSGADQTDLQIYGNQIALIVLKNSVRSENELDILEDAVTTKNKERLADLQPIIDAYEAMVSEMLVTEVPEAYAQHHLNLLNTYNAVKKDVEAMQKAYEDPMYTFLRFKRYEDDLLGMGNALIRLYDALYLKGDARWSADEPVRQIMYFDE